MKIKPCIPFAALTALALPVSGAVIVLDDDGDRDFAAGPDVVTTAGMATHDNGGWGVGNDKFNGTNSYNGPNAGTAGGPSDDTATYMFTVPLGVVTGGTYNIYATWGQNGQNNNGPATYSCSEGALVGGAVNHYDPVADDIQILDPFVGDNKKFQLLGQVVEDGDGVITVTLTGTTANFITVDAVAIDLVPEPSASALLGLGGLALMLRRRRQK